VTSFSSVDPDLLALADNPNTHTPLGAGDERIVQPRFVLWMGSHPDWNVAQRFRFAAAELDEVMAEVHGLLRRRDRVRLSWEIGSEATPHGLAELLLDRGLVWDEPDPLQIGMVLDHEPPRPAGVQVRAVGTIEEYAASETIAYTSFGSTGLTEAQIAQGFGRYDPNRSRRYLASVDGQDVATGNASFTPHGVVLNAGSTLPEWRGRGAYRALVRARWDDAVAAGTPALVTQAGRMSLPILERIGFVAVCEIRALMDDFGARNPTAE
jgi:GNAT superfamily N-acetyltransferase